MKVPSSAQGSLIVVGLGIRVGAQTTLEAEESIRKADRVFYVAADSLAPDWIADLNPAAQSLGTLYAQGKARHDTYTEMTERILEAVRAGQRVCVAAYGHPGVFATPFHRAIDLAYAEGFDARMLPGVSAEDCLFADLGLDPGTHGAQSFEATDFLIFERRFDPTSLLILWQVGAIGVTDHRTSGRCWNPNGLAILCETLSASYGAGHDVIIYEAATFPLCPPKVTYASLGRLASAETQALSTLVVPPLGQRGANLRMLERLQSQQLTEP